MLSSRTFYFQECCWLFQHCKRLNVFILQKRVFPLNCNAASPNRNPKYFRCQILNHFLFPNQCNNRFKQFESTEWEIALNWLASCFFFYLLLHQCLSFRAVLVKTLIAILTATAAWKLVPQPIMMRRLQRLISFRWSLSPPRTTKESGWESESEHPWGDESDWRS